ncbi:uncharacterized protein LOC135336309 [Halichondria panicea]|uniref:uncharacterized protein LOC135336309 n=1 Tax=Halichondria panicea TaxID=6063 RepID=UPI00312B563C
MATASSLESLCFDHIMWTLDSYKTEDLCLLPKAYRTKFLLRLPIIDVCQLESSPQFIADIDMESIWEQLNEEHFVIRTRVENWKHSLFDRFAKNILNCSRPHGYFMTLNRFRAYSPWEGGAISTDGPIDKHPVDIINYLVAIKREDQNEKSPTVEDGTTRSEALSCHQMTLMRGVVPPGEVYHRACEATQRIPPRYVKFFAQNSRFLPDLTAIELINKTGFCLKSMDITFSTFGTFLHNARDQGGNYLGALTEMLKNVESITFSNYSKQLYIFSSENIEETSQLLIELALLRSRPKLTSLTIQTEEAEKVIDCVTMLLTTSCNNLQTFKFISDPTLSQDHLGKLNAIFEYQSSLKSISIHHSDYNTDYRIETPVSVVKTWLQISVKNQNLQHLDIYISFVCTETFLSILYAFLSTPSSQEQTLTLRIILISRDASDKEYTLARPRPPGQHQSSISQSGDRTPSDKLRAQLEEIDESILQRKSLEFSRHVSFKGDFKPIKLGQLIATRIQPQYISKLLKYFEMTRLRLNCINLHKFKLEDYRKLLERPSLMTITFNCCKHSDFSLMWQAATLQGFSIEERKTTGTEYILSRIAI